MEPLRYKVVTPQGIRWRPTYLSTDAAWSRLLGVHNLVDTPANRATLIRKGWRVSEVTSDPRAL